MSPALIAPAYALAAIVGVLLMHEWGRRLAARTVARTGSPVQGGGAVESSVYAIAGLLLAFSFSGASSRFDERREMVILEANAVGTAWLRVDMLPLAEREPVRGMFREYVDARLAVYQALPDLEASFANVARANALQLRIWEVSSVTCLQVAGACQVLLPALNEMFDIASERVAKAVHVHPPAVIYAMLFIMVVISALLAGYGSVGTGSRSWLHTLVYALVTGVVLYVILDMEFPRFGFIRIDAVDALLVDLRRGMG